jgi:DNA-binding SARP family transcriptional activator
LSAKGLEIRLLGELELVRDGRTVELPASKKTRALLAYLVATGKPQLRERLCELLWEGPDDPRAALRWSLTKIRPLLDEKRLAADRERVSFEACGAVVDLVAVRPVDPATATTDALRGAAERFRGDLLEGLDLPDCYRYQEWLVGERETVRAQRIAILAALGERLRAEPEEALRWARARVAIEPLSEAAHVQVVRLLGELGRTREALKQYESCRRILESELGAKPSQELERARMALGQAQPEAPVAAPPPPAVPPPRAASSLVGRQKERAALEQAVAAASVGRARGVLLFMGEPGIGKSRLLDEAQALVRASGGIVLAGRAFEAEMVRPYGAWIDALRSARLDSLDAAARADLAPLLPELGKTDGAHGDRNLLFDAVARLLARMGPVALVLDDLHWFDEASAALLHYVVRALGETRVLIACGARPGELADNPAALRLVRALSREGQLAQHTLLPLDASETAALVSLLDPRLDAARIFADSDGNPLFALEIARSLAAGDDALSDSLEGLIADRLSRLEEGARDLLPWAAALGHGFSPELLAHVTGVAPADLLVAVEELERRSVFRVAAESGYDFAHDLIRQGAYRQLSEPRRRLVHLQIARAMAKLPDPDGALAGDLAHHARIGGEHELGARACLTAAMRCWRLFANSEALELIERGLQHITHIPRAARVPIHIPLLKYKSFVLRDTWPRLAPTLEEDVSTAIIDAQAAGDQFIVSDGFFVLSALHHDRQDFPRAQENSLQALEAARAGDETQYVRQLANTGRCLMLIEGDVGRARTLIDEARVLAERLRIDDAEISWGQGLSHYWVGEYPAALAALDRCHDKARAAQDRWREHQSLEQVVRLHLERDDAEAARARLPELLDVASKCGGGSEEPLARALAALLELHAGRWEALAATDVAIQQLVDADSRLLQAYVHNFVALFALRDDRAELARQHAAAALEAARVVRRRSEQAIARALLARAALAAGDSDAARDQLQPVLPQMMDPNAISARAREIVGVAAQALGLPISTVAPTRITTDPA